jgi:hypothetical protein
MCSGGGEDSYTDLQYIRRRYVTKEQLIAEGKPHFAALFATAALEKPQKAAAISASKRRARKIRQPSADPDPADQLGEFRTAIRRTLQVRYCVAARDSRRRINSAALYEEQRATPHL